MRVREGYDVALICMGGHVVNSFSQRFPETNTSYCEKCGEKAIWNCTSCNAPIRGGLWPEGAGQEIFAPSFCNACGKPFPWTETALQAAIELAADSAALDAEDRRQFAESLNDLIKDTPRTPLAASRLKRIIVKVGRQTGEIFEKILVDVLSETAKKMVFPDSQPARR